LDKCQRIVSIPKKRAAAPTIDYLEREELGLILARIDRRTAAGRRDYAMLSLTYQTAARVQEVVGLRACDLQLDPPPQVRIWGKGRKDRLWATAHNRSYVPEKVMCRESFSRSRRYRLLCVLLVSGYVSDGT
jgi:site-specific recombinase XerD